VRVRHVITLTFGVAVIGLAGWSFYANVLAPHSSGQPMEGMAVADETTLPTDSGAGAPVAAGSEATAVVPPALGGIPLTALQSGEEAIASVEELHGESLGSDLIAAWVAQYGNGREASLWVSRSADQAGARALFARMTDKISQDTTPFTGLTPMAGSALEGYQLDGMGQKHFYFVAGTDLYWLSVDPQRAQPALADLTKTVISASAAVN